MVHVPGSTGPYQFVTSDIVPAIHLINVDAAGVMTEVKKWEGGGFHARFNLQDELFDLMAIPRGDSNFLYLTSQFEFNTLNRIDLVLTPTNTTEKRWDPTDDGFGVLLAGLAIDATPGMVIALENSDRIFQLDFTRAEGSLIVDQFVGIDDAADNAAERFDKLAFSYFTDKVYFTDA
jgi:hypothetical protein